MSYLRILLFKIITLLIYLVSPGQSQPDLSINELEYFETTGINVMVYHDYYAVGHQSGVTLVQNGERVLANGDVRLWPKQRPYPDYGQREVNFENQQISITTSYNDSSRQQFNDPRFTYPELNIESTVHVKAEGRSFRITVDLKEPLPSIWEGRIGWSIELFPGKYFDHTFYMDGQPGMFPRSMNGPVYKNNQGDIEVEALAKGKKLMITPELPNEMITIQSFGHELQLLDGRVMRNNGWFVVRSPLRTGVTSKAAEWLITPNSVPDFQYSPVIQVSQVGYKPNQEKVALIEMDKKSLLNENVILERISDDGRIEILKSSTPAKWGNFLRYQYAKFDFSEIKNTGIYRIRFAGSTSHTFRIDENIFKRHVWQPTLEYYLPAQMCHMRVNDRLKVWHGLCHNDDALMAPVSHIHFDGYRQGPSTLTSFQPGDPVPGLNAGGWHDAGDYDLRVESQANTVRILAQAWDLFKPEHDETSVNQNTKIVEMHVPDGVPDILQQIEHGAITITAGYNQLGRLYRGIICYDRRQYSLLGDGSTMTDNLKYDASLSPDQKTGSTAGLMDDRWVFTEDNPRRELNVAACLATAFRALKDYNNDLANNCLQIAKSIWEQYKEQNHIGIIDLTAELILSTNDEKYMNYILTHSQLILSNTQSSAVAMARISSKIKDKIFLKDLEIALRTYSESIASGIENTPFGVQYRPNIWGDGWNIQRFGVHQYFLHKGFPEIFSMDPVINAMNFVLGVHPGSNTASYVSGVGTNSLLVAYGTNRDEWSYIPGGSASGTALIRPNLPELKEWPYFWQQTEYVMGGGATNFMFLVLASDELVK